MNVWYVTERDRKTGVELRERMDIKAVGVVVRKNKLRWCDHVERKEYKD